MIATKAPIGEIITFIRKNKDVYGGHELIGKIGEVVDLILLRTKNKGVVEALNSLNDNLFKIRIELMGDAELLKSVIQELNGIINERINNQFKASKKIHDKNLEQSFINSISIYGEIAGTILKKLPKDPIGAIGLLPKISFEEFNALINSLPGNESKFIPAFIKSSIDLDFAFIVYELISAGELELKSNELKQLNKLFKDSTERFAVFSNVFGLWRPEEPDERQWMRNIKIRIGQFESFTLLDKIDKNDISKILAA